MRSYIVKENHKGSAVSEILQYRQTQIMLFLYKNRFKFAKKSYSSMYFVWTYLGKSVSEWTMCQIWLVAVSFIQYLVRITLEYKDILALYWNVSLLSYQFYRNSVEYLSQSQISVSHFIGAQFEKIS